MAFQLLLNFMIAFLWMFLHNDWTGSRFVIGFLLGILVLLGMRRVWTRLYLEKVWALIKLTLMLLRDLVVSSYVVVKLVLRPGLNIHPTILKYTTELTSDWEVAALITFICLIPGSVVLEVSDDKRTLYIHAMDVDDVAQYRANIRDNFERAILEVSR